MTFSDNDKRSKKRRESRQRAAWGCLRPLVSRGVVGHRGVFGQAVPCKVVVLGLSAGGVPPCTAVPFILSLLEAPAGPSVDFVHPQNADKHRQRCHREHNGREQHEHSSCHVGAEERDGRQPPTRSPSGETHCLQEGEDKLHAEDEEEGHEIKGAVRPKGFVHRSEPADVAAGAEEDQPEDGQAKVDTIATSNPPRQAGNDVHDQRDAVKDPDVVDPLHQGLIIDGYLIRKVLVEAGLQGDEFGERWEVIHLLCHGGSGGRWATTAGRQQSVSVLHGAGMVPGSLQGRPAVRTLPPQHPAVG